MIVCRESGLCSARFLITWITSDSETSVASCYCVAVPNNCKKTIRRPMGLITLGRHRRDGTSITTSWHCGSATVARAALTDLWRPNYIVHIDYN